MGNCIVLVAIYMYRASLSGCLQVVEVSDYKTWNSDEGGDQILRCRGEGDQFERMKMIFGLFLAFYVVFHNFIKASKAFEESQGTSFGGAENTKELSNGSQDVVSPNNSTLSPANSPRKHMELSQESEGESHGHGVLKRSKTIVRRKKKSSEMMRVVR